MKDFLRRFSVVLLVLAALCFAVAPAFAGDCPNGNCAADRGAGTYVVVMARTRVFRHDPTYRGAEVIFWSSGQATPEAAIATWRASPAHAALLPRIRVIRCAGNFCVGR